MGGRRSRAQPPIPAEPSHVTVTVRERTYKAAEKVLRRYRFLRERGVYHVKLSAEIWRRL